jgi:arylsulfatase A-like enzyme
MIERLCLVFSNMINSEAAVKYKSFLECKLLFLTCLATFFVVTNPSRVNAQSPVARPNIILINLDDADIELLSRTNISARFPNLKRFVDDGLQFTNFHVTTPLCGPSRACLFRGQYAHNTGILCNNPASFRSNGFDGGMRSYHDRGYLQNDVSTWVKSAGYRTMMVGKFLHHDTMLIVPPGWDDFYHYTGGDYFGSFRFSNEFAVGGIGIRQPIDSYRTDLETIDAVNIIEQHNSRSADQPYFMYLSPFAPHSHSSSTREQGMVSPKYETWWPELLPQLNLSIGEWDMSDKTTALANVPRLNAAWTNYMNRHHRERTLSMMSVDEMFGKLYQAVAESGELNKTYFLITSDNGMEQGHRRLFGKSNSYDRTTNVPFYVLGPNVPRGTFNHLLAHIDIAPTVTQLAGGAIPPLVDGKSFMPLMFAPTSVPERDWREAVLIENWESTEATDQQTIHLGSNSVRFYESSYTEWADGTSEYFNLRFDPLQLSNLFQNLTQEQKSYFSNYLRVLKKAPHIPKVSFSDPFNFNELVRNDHAILGMAEDASGVDSVKLTIRRISDFQYWSGRSWQVDPIRVDAELTNPGQQLTSWRYKNTPAVNSSDELVGVWARVYDDEGNYNPVVPGQLMRFDMDEPDTTILAPALGSNVSDRPTVSGTSYDSRSVLMMKLVVKNLDNAQYWNGSAWQTDWTSVLIPVSNGKWYYQLPSLPQGGLIYIGARGVDDSGNLEFVPEKTYFWVNR